MINKKIPSVFVIDYDDKHYPEADKWMWTYCQFLGKFTDSNGKNYDLGVFTEHASGQILDATVYDNKAGSYSSGEMKWVYTFLNDPHREWFVECHRRAKLLGLIPPDYKYVE